MSEASAPPLHVLVTGSRGQVGHEILRDAGRYNIDAIGLDRQALDITDPVRISQVLQRYPVDAVINTAAYTAVDHAEQDRGPAYAVNRDAAAHLAQACARQDIPLLHLSTDYVFDGDRQQAYTETDTPFPLGVYGASKLAGEQQVARYLKKHIILRTSWVFGAYGQNFVKTMLRLARERDRLSVVDDQRGCPTPARAVAQAALTMLGPICRPAFSDWGIYHYCGAPETSWFGFARQIFTLASGCGLLPGPVSLKPIPGSDYPTAARRPANSSLDSGKIGHVFGLTAADWQAGLAEVLAELSSSANKA